jgi:hypothetical protein
VTTAFVVLAVVCIAAAVPGAFAALQGRLAPKGMKQVAGGISGTLAGALGMYLSYGADSPRGFIGALIGCVGGAVLCLRGATERLSEAEREEKRLVLPPKA